MWDVREREESRTVPGSLAWDKEGVTIHQGANAEEEGMGGSSVLDMLCRTCPVDVLARALG